MVYPKDLDERIAKYLKDNNEEWIDKKHYIYIQITKESEILVIEEWNYKCNPPTPKQLDITPLKIILRK